MDLHLFPCQQIRAHPLPGQLLQTKTRVSVDDRTFQEELRHTGKEQEVTVYRHLQWERTVWA